MTTISPPLPAEHEPREAEPPRREAAKQSPRRRRIGLWLFVPFTGMAALAAWRFELIPLPAAKSTPVTTKSVAPTKPALPWDGLITLSESQQKTMGIATIPVVAQTEPIRLSLVGTTKYDEDLLSRVRIMFQGRVDKVHVRTGQHVRRGDALLGVYSTALADAKNDYEIRLIEWEYQSRLAKTREELRKQGSIAEQLYLETRNEELRKHRELDVAHDRLAIYGLSDDEIAAIAKQSGTQKARMTVRAPADGVIVDRKVVAGNLYDESDELLVVTPVDHLWVWGNVFESDIDLVHVGQTWEIKFPFLRDGVKGRVEYISNHVDPSTHAVRIRTSIPNTEGRIKADMLVSGALEVEPISGRTIVPRSSLIVAGDQAFVFVRKRGGTEKFERRRVKVVHETATYAIAESGLEPDDEAVTIGALILAQLFEDHRVCTTGLPQGCFADLCTTTPSEEDLFYRAGASRKWIESIEQLTTALADEESATDQAQPATISVAHQTLRVDDRTATTAELKPTSDDLRRLKSLSKP